MDWNVVKGLFSAEEIAELCRIAEEEMAKHPFPEHLHPAHGTLRPQRLEQGQMPAWLQERILAKLEEVLGSISPAPEESPYFIFYPVDTLMHEHTDSYPQANYWRIGILLKQDCVGGIFKLEGKELELEVGDMYIFHANKLKHEVTKITEGERLIIASGYIN